MRRIVAHTLFYFTRQNDLVFDPPYFRKMAAHYMKGSISDFSRSQYLNFFKDLFCLMRDHSKSSTRIAFLNAGQKNPGHYQKNFDHREDLKAIKKNEYYHMVRNDFDFNLICLQKH